MRIQLIQWLSRITLFVCGMTSLLISRRFFQFFAFGGFGSRNRWGIFGEALAAIGVGAIILAILPMSSDLKRRRISTATKMLGLFAILGYVLAVGLTFTPSKWSPGPAQVYSACPSCILTVTVDPSLAAVIGLLAPLNAAVYGAGGAILGYVASFVRPRPS
jgi:hypothetical protein